MHPPFAHGSTRVASQAVGRQVNFRMTEADRDLVVEHLRQQGAVFIPYKLLIAELVPLQRVKDAESGLVWAVRPEDFDKIVVRYIEAQGYWVVDRLRSAALECSLAGAWNVAEANGRFWYQTGHYNDDGSWVAQDPDFAAWADRQIAWVRRTFRRGRGRGMFYEGPGVPADSE